MPDTTPHPPFDRSDDPVAYAGFLLELVDKSPDNVAALVITLDVAQGATIYDVEGALREFDAALRIAGSERPNLVVERAQARNGTRVRVEFMIHEHELIDGECVRCSGRWPGELPDAA